MATLDTTSFAAALKTLWPQKRIAEIMYRNQPFLAAVPKDNNFGGANRVVAARYATPGSASHTASNPFTAGGAAALCSHPGLARVRSQPDRGCAFHERLPGVDDDLGGPEAKPGSLPGRRQG